MVSSLKKRVENLEKKLTTNNIGGIPSWALEVARDLSNRVRIDFEPVKRALEELRGKVPERPKPRNKFKWPELETEQDILNYAREISKKYNSLEAYNASLPPLDTTAIDKALEFIKD